MDMLKSAVTAWVAFLYAVAPAAIGLTVALRAWTPKHNTALEEHESSEEIR